MATDDIERLHYYQRQYLGALDFEDQQAYHRDMRRRLNLAQHTWGIVTGLELVPTQKAGVPNSYDINISPGMAIDGYGREIVMFAPTQLDPALLRSFRGAGYQTVCLEYKEALTQSPQAGYGQCDQPNQFGRVGENFQVVVQEPFRDDITVNGQAIMFPVDTTDPANPQSFFKGVTDPEDIPVLSSSSPLSEPGSQFLPLDESVPYQELPIDDPTIPLVANWLIPLGQVYWDGTTNPPQFSDKNVSVTLENGRHYIGSVASRLLTPARSLVVRDRNTNVPLPAVNPNKPDGVAMTIEGTLQIERLFTAKDDIQIHGGALDFRDQGGSSDGKGGTNPLFTLSRQGANTTTGISLRLQIGNDQAGKNRFVVGAIKELFTIDDTGNAHLAGALDGLSITGVLDFGSQPRQMMALCSSQDKSQQNAIGIQAMGSSAPSATTYFRSSNDFYWYKGGAHSNTPGDPGNSGQELMRLDASGGLNINVPLEVIGSLFVVGPTLSFLSTTDPGFFVNLGKIVPPHGSDSIYGSPNLWLDALGVVYVKKGARILSTDGAAFFPPNPVLPPQSGDVVVIDAGGTVSPATAPDDHRVVGAISTDPGFIFQSQYPLQGTPVTLMGTVNCNVDNTGGLTNIVAGDLLTTSSHQGYAQKASAATPRGAVFAKALEPMLQGGSGTIKVLIMPG